MSLPSRVTDSLVNRLMDMVVATGSDTYKMTEVYSGEIIAALPQSTPDDVERAYAQARTAQLDWAQWPLAKRLRVFRRLHELILSEHEIIADLIQIGTGKTRRMAFEESCDVPMVISHYLKVAPRLLKKTRRGGPVPMFSTSTELHRPKGVVGVISPWNFPFALGLSDAIPALMAGNGIVLKPDKKTALSALYGVELMYKAGLPKGLFQVVCGEGPDVGPALIDNADFVMFTGSTATGRKVGEQAGRNLIGCSLELGGKNPMIILDDANLDEVVPGATFAVFGNSGQACMHIERIYVGEKLHDEFIRRFVAAAEAIKVGASYDYDYEMGSLVSPEQKDRVAAHVEDARSKGATVLTGGKARPDLGPAFYEPTVLTGVTKDMLHGVTETFGPVVAIHRVSSEAEAIRLANDTDYGLNASVWGTDLEHAAAVGAQLEAGNVNINDGFAASYASKVTPSGGLKNSGVGVRHGDAGLLKYTDTVNLAVLKKQVLTKPADRPYDKSMKETLIGLRVMRKLRVR